MKKINIYSAQFKIIRPDDPNTAKLARHGIENNKK